MQLESLEGRSRDGESVCGVGVGVGSIGPIAVGHVQIVDGSLRLSNANTYICTHTHIRVRGSCQ